MEERTIKFCEYCGNFLDDNGRCPDPECVWNVILDKIAEIEAMDK